MKMSLAGNGMLVLLAIQAMVAPCLFAGPKLIHAGPMVGHVSESGAMVWLRIKEGSRIVAEARQGEERFEPVKIQDLDDEFFIVHFAGIKAATETRVELRVQRKGNEFEETSVSFRTSPIPAKTGRIRIAFGSCSKVSQFKGGPVYQAIADESPDLAIFVGDNSYFIVGDGTKNHFGTRGPIGDWNSPEGMLSRHLQTRVHPDLARLFRTVPCYGIWDDHDYGPNNADREFELREEAFRIFRQMWANPSYGDGQTAGVFSSFRFGPVEVFLMDDRYHKYSALEHKDVTPHTGVIWGARQTDWLLAGLKATTAPIKIIANGTQFISQTEQGEGHFQEAKEEQQRVIDFLVAEKIGGVVFLSGDRHYSEAMRQLRPDGALLVECTSSPLQQGQEVGPLSDREHANQLWAMRGNSYGLVTINLPKEAEGTIRFEARDENNQVPVIEGQPRATLWKASQLNPGR